METKGNYLLVGTFALLGLLGLLGFAVWFAQVELDRQYSYYDIDFDSVSGLSSASDVRFAGFPVGRVVQVGLSPNRDGRIRVRIEVQADTPIRTGSVATIEPQGITGVAFVGLSPGDPREPLLADQPTDEHVRNIPAGQSALQSLAEDAPEILAETLTLIRDLQALIGDDNQEKVTSILDNVESASEAFAGALEDFSQVTGAVSGFAEQIDFLNNALAQITLDISEVSGTAEDTFRSLTELSERAKVSLEAGERTLATADDTMDAARTYIEATMTPATEQLLATAADLETKIDEVGEQASKVLETYDNAGRTANLRLEEAAGTLQAINQSIDGFGQAARRIDEVAEAAGNLISEDGPVLLTNMRTVTQDASKLIASLQGSAEEDLPRLLTEVREAAATTEATIEAVGANLRQASGGLDALIAESRETLQITRNTFSRANETLGSLNATLENGTAALLAAERAFNGADRLINEEGQRLTSELSDTITELRGAVSLAARDIPEVTANLRSAGRSADAAFSELERAIRASSPAVQGFASQALPQFTKLAEETRTLIRNLDRLATQIGKDRGRFLLQPRSPEYRR